MSSVAHSTCFVQCAVCMPVLAASVLPHGRIRGQIILLKVHALNKALLEQQQNVRLTENMHL